MKDGIPSGRTLEDVVNEVRKQAFYLKGKSVNDDPLDDLEDPLNTSISSLTTSSAKNTTSSSSSSQVIHGKEDWEKWFPMEWVAWNVFGPPSSDPCSHWVSENVSEGPKSFAERKKPAGRVDQRKKEIELKTVIKTSTDTNSLLSINTLLAQNELSISSRQDDLMQLNLMAQYARTQEERVSCCVVLYTSYLIVNSHTIFGIFI